MIDNFIMNAPTQRSFGPNRNSILTPFVAEALQLNQLIFSKFYLYPLQIRIINGQISLKFDHILQYKYISFLVIFIITICLGLGSCVLVLLLKLFCTTIQVDVAALMLCIFFSAFVFVELLSYILYFSFPEIETAGNQLFSLERKCEFFNTCVNFDYYPLLS